MVCGEWVQIIPPSHSPSTPTLTPSSSATTRRRYTVVAGERVGREQVGDGDGGRIVLVVGGIVVGSSFHSSQLSPTNTYVPQIMKENSWNDSDVDRLFG